MPRERVSTAAFIFPVAAVAVAVSREAVKRREYFLRHALELAFLVVSSNPKQDSGRSGLDISL